MSLAKRLRKIETSLTPKQALLLWLKEAQELGVIEHLEKSFKSPAHELPRARLTEMVGKAVRESLCKQGLKRELIVHAEQEARKQTYFLIVLVRDLQQAVDLECLLNAPYIVLLYEKLKRMLEQFTQCDSFEAVMWDMWRAVLIRRLCAMWRLRQTIMDISERYFDNHPLLFPEDTSTLEDQIHSLEESIKHYNSLEAELPVWTAIDVDALASSVREQVVEEVSERVANAKSTTLRDFGESEAAWKIVEPYALAHLEKLRAKDRQEEVTS